MNGGTTARDTSAEALPDSYLDLYKLAVEMADRVSARKATANTFFLTINTALFTFLGTRDFPWYGDAAGFVLAGAWWLLLMSYRTLNREKFRVIVEVEKRLPVKMYSDEWDVLGQQVKLWRHPHRWLRSYREIGAVERFVPLLFAASFLALALTHR